MPGTRGIVFPYAFRLREGGAIDVFPAAEIFFLTGRGESLSLLLVVDSGASISALPRSDAPVLGLDHKRGKPMVISGIGSDAMGGWRHEVPARIGNYTFQLPVVFLNDDTVPRVLGRAGIFERFTVIFEEVKHRSAFMGGSTSEARRVTKIIDGISE